MIRLISLFLTALTFLDSFSILAAEVDRLPGTELLTVEGDIPSQMVEGIHKYLDWKTAENQRDREKRWEARYSIQDSLDRIKKFRKMIGAADPRMESKGLDILGPAVASSSLASGKGYQVFKVRWAVFEGVTGEGLLLQFESRPLARVVAIPDADWSPEVLAGLVRWVQLKLCHEAGRTLIQS